MLKRWILISSRLLLLLDLIFLKPLTFYCVDALEKNLHVGVTLRLALVEEHPGGVQLVSPVDLLVLLLVYGLVLADLATVGLGFGCLNTTLLHWLL